MTALETRKTTLNQQGTSFTSLACKPGALESAIDRLTAAEGFNTHAAMSSASENVGVSTTSGGLTGHCEVVISDSARAKRGSHAARDSRARGTSR